MDLLLSFLSDLIAGLIGAGILAGLAILSRKIGSKQMRLWTDRLRRFGWPLLAAVFLATALTSAILRGATGPSAAVIVGLVVLVIAPVLLFRFGSAMIRSRLYRMRGHIWQILTGFFFLTTVLLLIVGPRGPAYNEQIVFVMDLADEEMMVMRDILNELEPIS